MSQPYLHEKSALENRALRFVQQLNCTGYLAGAEASSTYVDMAGRTVDQSLYTADVWFPGSVRTAMGVRNLYSKRYTLAANITFCHFSCTSFSQALHNKIILSHFAEKCKDFF